MFDFRTLFYVLFFLCDFTSFSYADILSNPGSDTKNPKNGAASKSCEQLRVQYTNLEKSSINICNENEDCGCYAQMGMYNLFLTTNQSIAKQLDALTQQYNELQCPSGCAQVSGPPVCKTQCISHQCKPAEEKVPIRMKRKKSY